MNLDKFIEQYIKGYLFQDLKKMIGITLSDEERYGAAGYPILSTSVAGMELLGWMINVSIINNKTKTDRKESTGSDFLFFWDHFMVPTNPLKYSGKGKLILNLVRHGIAHTFLAKPGILVTKNNSAHHMEVSQDSYLVVDAISFVKDFKNAFQIWESRIGDSKNLMEFRLKILLNKYTKDSSNAFKEYFASQDAATDQLMANPDAAMGSPAVRVKDFFANSISNASTSTTPLSAAPPSGMRFDDSVAGPSGSPRG
ncbi:MAG: hypothetical protein HGA38_02345 [Candidatus Moranbacteria bacterium]|nr:hypothetical protein [Candidatus Moranbacteria bacterium]